MKILFLTRKYPPIIGGMENQSYNLTKFFKIMNKETFLIANKKGNKFLSIFLPYSFIKALYLIKKNNITHLHLSDGLLAFEGFLIKKITGVKTIITIHGLDITYKNQFYQSIIPKSINRLDKIICISNATKEECVKRGINEKKIVVIPNGVNSDEFIIKDSKDKLRENLSKKININLKNKKILLTTGRLVKRKGVEWFIENVIKRLDKDYIYLVSGEGKEKENIKKSIRKNQLENKVFLLGKTDFDTLKLLYNSSDIFIMPNIRIQNNTEGFGIVVIEAGSCGLPVIASDIEGIKDAIINKRTGYLVKEKNSKDFINKIKQAERLNKRVIIQSIKDNFDWNKISRRYLEVMR